MNTNEKLAEIFENEQFKLEVLKTSRHCWQSTVWR